MKFTRGKIVARNRFYWAVWHPKGRTLRPSEMYHPQPIYIDASGEVWDHGPRRASIAAMNVRQWMIGDEVELPPFDPACPDFEETEE